MRKSSTCCRASFPLQRHLCYPYPLLLTICPLRQGDHLLFFRSFVPKKTVSIHEQIQVSFETTDFCLSYRDSLPSPYSPSPSHLFISSRIPLLFQPFASCRQSLLHLLQLIKRRLSVPILQSCLHHSRLLFYSPRALSPKTHFPYLLLGFSPSLDLHLLRKKAELTQ
jgi:hypothetical protein